MSHLALQDCRDRCFNCNKGGFIGDHQVRGSELFMGDLRRFQAVKPDKVTDKSPMQKKGFYLVSEKMTLLIASTCDLFS